MRPSASAASIIATPIRSLTLPAGLYASSFPISSASQSGATRVSLTIGVLPTRSARLSGIAFVGGETLIRRRGYRAGAALSRAALLAERDEGHADDRRLVRLGAHAERDPAAAHGALRGLHERDLEDLVRAVVDLRVRELGLDLSDRRADPHAARPCATPDGDVVHPARARQRVVDAALQRRQQSRRARVLGELAAWADLPDLAAGAQIGMPVAQVDAVDADRRDLRNRGPAGGR